MQGSQVTDHGHALAKMASQAGGRSDVAINPAGATIGENRQRSRAYSGITVEFADGERIPNKERAPLWKLLHQDPSGVITICACCGVVEFGPGGMPPVGAALGQH